MKKQLTRHAVLAGLMFIFFIAGEGYAKIPEPPHILYGLFPDGENVISAQINDEIISSYARGDISIAGDYFILRLPIDSVDPQEPGTARPGNEVSLFLDSETEAALILIVEERGTVQRVVLPTADDDGDGSLNSVDNCTDIANDDQGDADQDGQGDACDANSDTDGDGYTDMQEYENFQNGILDPADQPFNPQIMNVSGGTGYTDPTITSLLNAIKILQILSGLDTDCSECVIDDIGADSIFGLPEAIDSLRSAAGI